MKCEAAEGKSGLKAFGNFADVLYKDNRYFRGTEASIEKLLLTGSSAFHRHASVKPFLISDGNNYVARFALIHDKHLPDYVQISFFEALPEQVKLLELILLEARKSFPACTKVVAGLNGHLNYGAGILLNRFDETPVFGLPYTLPYYPAYFSGLNEKRMSSFRFRMDEYIRWAESYRNVKSMQGLNVRFMDKKNIRKESSIYTYLNNHAFERHPYWANREDDEDLELFYPFRFLLRNENLIIAEVNGNPVGFFLWYPDFNELVSSQRDLNVWDVIRYKVGKKIKVFRFTEIGVLPQCQKSPVGTVLLMKAIPVLKERGYEFCEGGFIFEENMGSIALASRMIHRSTGIKPEPYRSYAVYEGKL